MPVYKDKKGKFFFKCSIHSQQFLRRGFSTREEALNAERVFIVGYKGDSVPNFSLLVSSYLAYKKLLVKSSTFIHQKEDIERHVIGHFPDIGVDRISLGDFVKFRSYVASLKIKGGNVLLNYVVSIFKYCEDVFGYKCRFVRVLVPFRDDSFGIAKMAVKEKVFSLEDFEKFLSVCDDRMYRLMFILAFITGLRLGEARGLQAKSFDGKSLSVFQIASSKLRVGKSVLTSPKSKDSFRTYVLPGFLSDMLQSYIAEGGNGRTLCDYMANIKIMDIHSFLNIDRLPAGELGIGGHIPGADKRTGNTG